MRPTSHAYLRLTRLRQVSVLLMLVVCADVATEEALAREVIPHRADFVLVLAAFLLGVAAMAMEVLDESIRRRLREDHKELEARRKAEQEAEQRRQERRARVERVLEGQDAPEMVFQPIVDIRTGKVAGYEALSRFPVGRPDEWFAEAGAVGLGAPLELKAIRRALSCIGALPGDSPYLSVNASPETLLSPGLQLLLATMEVDRVVVELTEHVSVTDYDAVKEVVERLRKRGLRLAVDDVGAGYSSLRHIAMLQPDIIKLDASFTQTLSSDGNERAMVGALVGLAQGIGARTVVEGVEDQETLDAARDLGADSAQGWHLGKPQPLEVLSLPAQRRPSRSTALQR
jgi:EAL domain-containing protein (putative c-di-GMP-specific phosphodiesterase class I)